MRDAHLWAYVSPWDGIVSCRWIRYVVLLSGSHLKAICRSILYLQDRFPLSSAESFSPSTCPPSPVPAPRHLVWIKSRWWRTIIQMGLLRVFHLSNLSLSLSVSIIPPLPLQYSINRRTLPGICILNMHNEIDVHVMQSTLGKFIAFHLLPKYPTNHSSKPRQSIITKEDEEEDAEIYQQAEPYKWQHCVQLLVYCYGSFTFMSCSSSPCSKHSLLWSIESLSGFDLQ